MNPTTLIILITVIGVAAVGLAVRGVIRRELSAITGSRGLDPSGGHLKELMERLSEIDQIAKGVDALRMGLTNVKIRGGWGEVQLELILKDMLTANQYKKNVETVPGSNKRVEFAVMLPGRDGQKRVWLPIDSKFPLEDYLRLQEAMDAGNTDAIEKALKGLQTAIIKAAKDIRAKYVAPPHTTEFGVLFLPSEGLYAEALRSTKIEDELRGLRIVLAGPTTITALLHAPPAWCDAVSSQQEGHDDWANAMEEEPVVKVPAARYALEEQHTAHVEVHQVSQKVQYLLQA